jgi:nicotinamide riboside kinase
MNKPNYKVVICGAHSQGKTTLVNRLKESVLIGSTLNFSYRTNLTRDLNKILPINESGNSVSQYLIMARHLEFAVTTGRWIMDRGALDGIAYSHYFYDQGTVDKTIFEAIQKVYELCIPHYDKIFYVAPELPLAEDGQRSVNKEFFDGVVKQFDFYINHFSISDKVVQLTGSVDERAKRVITEIKKDFQDEL